MSYYVIGVIALPEEIDNTGTSGGTEDRSTDAIELLNELNGKLDDLIERVNTLEGIEGYDDSNLLARVAALEGIVGFRD